MASMGLSRASAKRGLASEDMKLESGSEAMIKDKTLYLCFREFHCEDHRLQVVRPVRLTRYEEEEEEEEEEEYLDEAAYHGPGIERVRVIGSQIVFPNGPHTGLVYSIHTSTRPIKFAPLKTPGDIDGKLYRLDNYISRDDLDHYQSFNSFEVFDLRVGDKWRPLDVHPFLLRHPYNVAFLGATKIILGWVVGERGVFCFDTSKPDNGWTKVPPALGDALPCFDYYNRNTLLFIDGHHSDIGDLHLYFHYEPKKDPLLVSHFYLSNNFDSFKAINNPIQLPVLCPEYCLLFAKYDNLSHVTSDFEFVHLGAQKVGLV